jgi:hypothetical protein
MRFLACTALVITFIIRAAARLSGYAPVASSRGVAVIEADGVAMNGMSGINDVDNLVHSRDARQFRISVTFC